MFLELLTHKYFWLSFFPVAFLGVGFWLLYFDRQDNIKEPLSLLLIALGGGLLSAIFFVSINSFFPISSFLGRILGEEFLKIIGAIFVIEVFQKRFHSVSQGIMYGFAVGLGFALIENLLYLSAHFENFGFDESFWLQFQARFWGSTLIHGVSTGFFGLFYAGAYTAPTLKKGKNESPFRAFFIPPTGKQLLYILCFHVTRRHLIFQKNISQFSHHAARTVVLEGFLFVSLFHTLFNLSFLFNKPFLGIGLSLLGLFYLRKRKE